MRRTTLGTGFGPILAVATVLGLTGAGPTTESWDAIYLAGSKVGHIHTYIEPVSDRGRPLLRVRVDMVLNYKRNNDAITTKMQYGTIETPDGSILRLDTRFLASGQEMRAHGDVNGKTMTLTLEGAGETQKQAIDWGPDVRGPYAAEQSLAHEPMKPGDTRALKMYMPDLNRVCDVTLTAKEREDVKLGGGVTRQLVRIEQTTMLDGKPKPMLDVTLWVDSGGQVLKQKTDVLGGMVMFRTTQKGALTAHAADVPFDQILHSIIKIKRKFASPYTTRDVRYKVTIQGDDASQVLPNDRRQTVTPGKTKSEAEVEVKTAGPNQGPPETGPVDPAYLRPNTMITCRDEKVVNFSRLAVGSETDPWGKSKKIQHWVATNLTDKNFETGFAPASEVAQTLSGDCSEHSVLVAAMCRASGVPSRVVVGLVYAKNLGGFGFHMWNEVFVNQRWVAIDASFDEDDVDAVHLKLADASLDGVSPYEAFLPILRVLGKTTLEPIEVR